MSLTTLLKEEVTTTPILNEDQAPADNPAPAAPAEGEDAAEAPPQPENPVSS